MWSPNWSPNVHLDKHMMIEQPTTVKVVENRYQINATSVNTKRDTKCSSEYTHANYNEYCPSTEVAMKFFFQVKWKLLGQSNSGNMHKIWNSTNMNTIVDNLHDLKSQLQKCLQNVHKCSKNSSPALDNPQYQKMFSSIMFIMS